MFYLNFILLFFLFFLYYPLLASGELVNTNSSSDYTSNYASNYAKNDENDVELSNEKLNYGNVFIAEERLSNKGYWELNLGYGYEFSNAYYHIYKLHLAGIYNLNTFFAVGPEFNFYKNKEKYSSATFNEQIRNIIPLKQEVRQPLSSTFLTGHLYLLQGKVNFFSKKVIKMRLVLKGGLGRVTYEGGYVYNAACWELGILPNILKNVDLKLSLNQVIEMPFMSESVSRTQVQVGSSIRF